MRKFVTLLSVLVLSLVVVKAEDRGDVWGARPLSLGNAYIGLANDGYAPFFNPAGIAQRDMGETTLTYGQSVVAESLPDKEQGAFSHVQSDPEAWLPFGIFGTHVSTAGVHRENMVGLNLARNIMPHSIGSQLFAGVNIKYLHTQEKAAIQTEKGVVSGDFGLLWVPHPHWSFGAVVRDFNRPKPIPNRDTRKPVTYGFGGAWQVDNNTSLLLDVEKIQGDSTIIRGGIERWFLNRTFSFRVGANDDAATLGLGINKIPFLGTRGSLEYGFAYPYDLDKDQRRHVVSLKFRWAGKAREIISEIPLEPELQDRQTAREASSGFKPGAELSRADERESKIIRKIRDLKRQNSMVVGPADEVVVDVKDHPELATVATVDAWGFLELPFVGDLRVQGRSTEDIRRKLTDVYQGFVEDPQVTVNVKTFNSRVFYVFGEVKEPGKFPMEDKRITVRDAVVTAGLPTQRAARWRAFVVRQGEEGPTYQHINLYRVLYRGDLRNDITLQSGDVIYVPMGVLDRLVTFIGRLVGPLVGLAGGIFGDRDDD